MKVLGMKLTPLRIFLVVVVVVVVWHMMNQPLRISPRESFTAFGSPVGEQPTADVITSWLKKPFEMVRNPYETNQQGRNVVDEHNLDLLADNKFSAECCLYDSRYSSADGCACLTPEQKKILGKRA